MGLAVTGMTAKTVKKVKKTPAKAVKKEVVQQAAPVVQQPTFTEWQDMQVNGVNRLPMHATFFAYESESVALKGDMRTSIPTDSGIPTSTMQAGARCRFLAFGS